MATTTTPQPVAGATNPRGIPSFPFMASVSDYVTSPSDVEPTLQRFTEMINKYTFMQSSVEKRSQGLREKLPEIKNTLDVVRFLRKRREGAEADDEDETGGEIQTTFPLSDTLYASATIAPGKLSSVYLWLGANVMVSYPLAEAEELLASKLAKARESLQQAEEDLEFLRVQITGLEVATARVYNWDVGEKRRRREEEKATGIRDGDVDGEGV